MNGRTVATLTFSGANATAGSLDDGNWTLVVHRTQVSAVGTMAGDFNQAGIKRLFGDASGDGVVNGLDFGLFRNAFGTTAGDANYLNYLDFDGLGVVNGLDFGQFRNRFGSSL